MSNGADLEQRTEVLERHAREVSALVVAVNEKVSEMRAIGIRVSLGVICDGSLMSFLSDDERLLVMGDPDARAPRGILNSSGG